MSAPRPAATVILLRDTGDGIETFVMRRASTMAFAPRMHVFPGGRVDDRDYAESVTFVGVDETVLAERASADVAGVRALYSCAIRETAEEAGIDIGLRDGSGALVVDPSALPLVDHWVTPDVESHRYDVRFFAACVDDARLTTTEADDAGWITPAAAVDAFEAGEMAMLPPTEAVLRWLSGFAVAADALAAGGARPVVPLIPRRITDENGTRWVLAHDRTGEIVVDGVRMPHTRETDGRPMEDG